MTKSFTGRRLAAGCTAAALAIAGNVGVFGATSAHAESGCHYDNLSASPVDSGGADATAWWQYEDSCYLPAYEMQAHFDAYDEVLTMRRDTTNNMTNVHTLFKVYDDSGETLLDEDTIWFRDGSWGTDSHQVGTPDGSGNIAEGRVVRFKICGRPDNRPGTYACSAWAKGRA